MRRSKDRYGANVGEAGSGEPGEGRALRARFSDVDLIHELPYGPAACEPPHQRPNTWQHPIQRRSCPKILLAPEGASTHALQGFLDVRYGSRDGSACAEFSWEGQDDNDPACGRGWASLGTAGRLVGHFYIHLGDDSGFVCERA